MGQPRLPTTQVVWTRLASSNAGNLPPASPQFRHRAAIPNVAGRIVKVPDGAIGGMLMRTHPRTALGLSGKPQAVDGPGIGRARRLHHLRHSQLLPGAAHRPLIAGTQRLGINSTTDTTSIIPNLSDGIIKAPDGATTQTGPTGRDQQTLANRC
jgi:hypothetical protein